MEKRIFIGIPASEVIKAKADEFYRAHQSLSVRWIKPQNLPQYQSPTSRARYGAAYLRWVKSSNLHITLVPPWTVDNGAWNIKHEALRNKLQEAAKQIKPFEIVFDGITFGPDEKNPRMVWAVGKLSPEAKSLQKRVEKSVYSLTHGRELKNRSFKLHITLARLPSLRSGAGGQARIKQPLSPSLSKFGEGKIDWHMLVDRFVLYESRLSPQGAEYEVLEEFNIK